MNLVWRMHVSEHAHMDGFILVSKHAHSMNPNTFKWTDRACIQTSSNRGCRTVSPLKQPLLIGWQTSVGLPEFKVLQKRPFTLSLKCVRLKIFLILTMRTSYR